MRSLAVGICHVHSWSTIAPYTRAPAVASWLERDLSLADARSESPTESTVRVALVIAGVEPPTPQYSVMRQGYFVARVDLAWPEIRFASNTTANGTPIEIS